MNDGPVDRRRFLKTGGLLVAGFTAGSFTTWGLLKRETAPSTPRATVDLSKGTPTMAELSKTHFDAFVGDDFAIYDESTKFSAKLTSVDGKVTERVESFSIVFEIPGTQVMPQRMRKVSHSKLGTHEMFLVPIGNDGKATRYEAVFTRLLNQGGTDV